jgi:hypothetical protein
MTILSEGHFTREKPSGSRYGDGGESPGGKHSCTVTFPNEKNASAGEKAGADQIFAVMYCREFCGIDGTYRTVSRLSQL